MPWIFSYSELGPQQIEELLGHAPFCALPASTPNFKVSFKGKSRKWASPVATLDRNKGNWVYGSALLVTLNEVSLFDKYFQNYLQVEVPMLIDATKDKIKAITYILDKDAPYGQPSDDYVKTMLKHLKFFWGQGNENSTALGLENFGIHLTVPKNEEKNEVVTSDSQLSVKTRKRRAKIK